MTFFLLIRHATHAWVNRGLAGRLKGIHLTEEGVREAKALAAQLSHLPILALYSSPLDRTRETAAALADELGINVVYDAAFLEIDFGCWTGLSFAALAGDPAWIRWNEHREKAGPPGGESMGHARARAVDQLAHLSQRHGATLVAIVSHGDIIRAILTHCLGWSLDDIHRLTIDPASVSLVAWEGDAGEIVVLNHRGAETPLPLPQLSENIAAA